MSRRSSVAPYKGWLGWLAVAMVAAGLLAVGVSRSHAPRTADERVESIARRVACPVCNGESVADSQAPASVQIRTNIANLVADGKLSDAEIIAAIDARYEGNLSLLPGRSGFDALIWVLPAMAAVGGAGGLVVAFAHWRRRAGDGGPSAADRALVAAALGEEPVPDPDHDPAPAEDPV